MRLLLEQSARLASEQDAIAQLAASQAWLVCFKWGATSEFDICVNADVAVGGHTYELRIVYPDLFPDVPALVQPRNREHWSGHQYGHGGALCLEWGPDNWSSEVTGAMLLESAYRLLSIELPGPAQQGDVPSRHAETEGQRLRQYSCRIVLTPELEAALTTLGTEGRMALATRTLLSEDAVVAIASPVHTDSKDTSTLVSTFESVDGNSWTRNGYAIVDSRFSELPASVNRTSLTDFLRAQNLWPWTEEEERVGRLLMLVAPGQKPRIFAFGVADSLSEYEIINFQQSDAVRRPLSHLDLSTKSVSIIGLGSVGSKLAVSLARAGVRRFVLIDDDVLAPHNLIRHELDWREVGLHKVTAVAKAIKLVAPDAVVQTRRLRLVGQENSRLASATLEQVGACDLVVDATASSDVLALLSAVCARRKKPLVWGELFAGGYGGMMARSRPGCEADGLTVRNGINQYFENLPEPPVVVATNYDAVSENQVLVASDADVAQLAAAMTQFSLDTLVLPSESAYPFSAYLLGFRAGWIFTAPFHTIQLEVATAGSVANSTPSLDTSDLRMKTIIQGITEDISAFNKSAT